MYNRGYSNFIRKSEISCLFTKKISIFDAHFFAMLVSVVVYEYGKIGSRARLTPFFENGIRAGFPSPAADYMEKSIDLNEALIRNPSSTFIGRITGDSMVDMGIFDGALAIIDKSLQVTTGDIVVAWVDGGFTLKKLLIESGKVLLIPFNKKYKPIVIDDSNEGAVWGKVTHIINEVK